MFEETFEAFLREQIRCAEGQRLEMLQRNLAGTKELLEKVLLPVLGTFDGLVQSRRINRKNRLTLPLTYYEPTE